MATIKSLNRIIRTTWIDWAICADERVNFKISPRVGRMVLLNEYFRFAKAERLPYRDEPSRDQYRGLRVD